MPIKLYAHSSSSFFPCPFAFVYFCFSLESLSYYCLCRSFLPILQISLNVPPIHEEMLMNFEISQGFCKNFPRVNCLITWVPYFEKKITKHVNKFCSSKNWGSLQHVPNTNKHVCACEKVNKKNQNLC